MSYVGDPFLHDIFISYSHGDVDGHGNARLQQWSESFALELEAELKAFPDIGAGISVFLDQHYRHGSGVDPMDPLDPQLKKKITGSAILAVLMSPHYLTSRWCGDERDWWFEAQAQHELPAEGRVSVARIWPTADAWPDSLADHKGNQLVGYHFFDRARAETRPQPFGWPKVDRETGNPFRDAVLNMVGDLRVKLLALHEELEDRKRRAENMKRLSATDGQIIYLHGRQSQEEKWNQMNEFLAQEGFVVGNVGPEPMESDPRLIRQSQNLRVQTMSGCDAIFLVGAEDERELAADLMVVGRLDRHAAVALSNKLLPCAVLDTAGAINVNNDWQRKAAALDIEWFDASTEPWLPGVQTWLQEIAE